MPSVSASCGAVTLTSRRSGSTWSQASYNATLTFDTAVPTNCTVTSAVLTATISADPMSGSTVYLNGVGINSGKGSKSINVSVSPGASAYSVAMTFKGSGSSNSVSSVVFSGLSLTVTYTLNQVKSTFTLSASSVEAGGSVKVTISPYLTTYTHTVTLAFGDKSSSTSLAAGTTTTTLTVPIAWLDQIPSASSGLGSVTVVTLENGTAFGSNSTSLTVKVPSSAAPDIGTCAVAPLLTVGGVTYPSVVSGGYVQNKSGYKATITGAGGKYGASIQSYNISGAGYSGASATLSSGLLTSAGSQTITLKVTDTRGMTASKTMTISVAGYSAPSIVSVKAYRVDDTGAASLQGGYGKWSREATYTTLGGANTLTVKGYLCSADGTEQLMAYEDTGDGTSWVQDSSKEKIALPLVNAYVVRVEATDKYGTVSQTVDLPSANFAMHFNAAGNGVCFGAASTRENAVEIAEGRTLWIGDKQVVPGAAAAYNLLDNSDFCNPVNQRGIASGATLDKWAYSIDRWKNMSSNAATITLSSAGVQSTQTMAQYIGNVSELLGKTCTAAACWADGTVLVASGTITMSDKYKEFAASETVSGHRVMIVDNGNSKDVTVQVLGSADSPVAWAALYEGEYTAATLPPYIPKGYAAELAECRRYFVRDVAVCTMGTQYTSANGLVAIHIPRMRVNPTITLQSASSQGWGSIELSKFSAGWSSTYGSGYTMNYVYSGTADTRSQFVGVTFTLQYDASADL